MSDAAVERVASVAFAQLGEPGGAATAGGGVGLEVAEHVVGNRQRRVGRGFCGQRNIGGAGVFGQRGGMRALGLSWLLLILGIGAAAAWVGLVDQESAPVAKLQVAYRVSVPVAEGPPATRPGRLIHPFGTASPC